MIDMVVTESILSQLKSALSQHNLIFNRLGMIAGLPHDVDDSLNGKSHNMSTIITAGDFQALVTA